MVCTFVSPFAEDREFARSLVDEGRFLEIFVDTPLEECEKRDPKGLYARARRGEITNMTGINSPYEPPAEPELHLQTVGSDPESLADLVETRLRDLGIIPQDTE